ncbi:MAG: hypothetical protein ACM3VY_00290 [Candidatus Bathyarchaeota archaeon]
MPARIRSLAPIILACAQTALGPAAWAEGAYDSDWLIERWNGRWELASRGAAGRVEKMAPNQEVLRLGKDGTVLVMTMPEVAEGGTVLCFASKRRDYRSPCSSAFLECSQANDGAYVTAVNGLAGFNMMDVRSRLECRIDSNAVLRAAQAVGMISTILPVAEKERANP